MFVWAYPAVVTRLVDADTFRADLDLGMSVWMRDVPVRVLAMNAPERNTPAGKLAAAFAAKLLPAGGSATVHSYKLDSFGRILGRVILPDGLEFASVMISAGHATAYPGKAR